MKTSGKSLLRPQGMLIAGCPVMSNTAVLANISWARCITSLAGDPSGGMGVALIGSVGITITSHWVNALS